jgi:hypothetical protein
MCGPPALALAAAATVAVGQLYGGLAANAQGKYENQVAQQNAKMEQAKVGDAKERGAIDRMRRYREASQAIGRSRADAGAGGMDVGFGSVFNNELDTSRIAGEDVLTIGKNTTREIEGYDINVSNFISSGRAAKAKGKAALVGSAFQAAGTLMGGASQFSKAKAKAP